MDEINFAGLSSDNTLHMRKRKLRAVYSVVEAPPEIVIPDDVIDEIVWAAYVQAERDYDALPRWTKMWHTFLITTGLWRVLNFLGRYTPHALRLRWYYWRHREEMEAEYGKLD